MVLREFYEINSVSRQCQFLSSVLLVIDIIYSVNICFSLFKVSEMIMFKNLSEIFSISTEHCLSIVVHTKKK